MESINLIPHLPNKKHFPQPLVGTENLNGSFVLNDKNTIVYHGNIINNKFHGKGRYTLLNGDEYEGGFENHHYHGFGIYRFITGEIYEGDFYNNQYHGNGKLTFPDGDNYIGEFTSVPFNLKKYL